MSIRIGEVIAVHGTKITLKIDEQSSKETLFYDGQKYKGVSIREYLSIQRGFRDIICMVEGEFLDESRVESTDGKITYVRKVEARPIGFFDQDGFKQGIKYMPMIKDAAYLLQEERILSIFDRGASGEEFIIGRMLKEDISINLPWKRLFNSHIGIFGNTGSGKSNTLAKLFTVLFEQKLQVIEGKSRFVILDFNGEYTGDQLAPSASKHVYALSTQYVPTGQPPADLYPLDPSEFWDLETLSLLFQATTNTQRPFLNRVIEGKKKYERNADSLTAYAKAKFRDAFCAGECKPATLDLMRSVARHVGNAQLVNLLREVNWHTKGARFFRQRAYFGTDGVDYAAHIEPTVDTLNITNLDAFDQLIVRTNLQLISDLIAGYVQFEHIQPLLKRVESALTSLRKVLTISNPVADEKILTVISLRRCNNEIKKVLPLLFAKHYYNTHKSSVATPPDRTVHLIIDEAHNILSQQSTRESESWKDYRLEQFEEIIKEGRKFGIFVTIASQRPADISPTIVSQLHNFFIHRLVNDRDLFLIDNTITTLDALSRSLIPGLAQGCCVVTGTAFDLPMVIQVDRLTRDKQPASEDVDLELLWSNAKQSGTAA
ncbi:MULTISPECIES: ATP-binding protein [Burkholderia cepacia complex]|uniref:ATP-binding protein n=1 Tax=Burkholderia stagnalis TaxID=1503054 RepID=A0ABX9YH18_9BURK|nr:ATP-binding protein [Burkholderia stagnalis]RQQ54474.1 ATP-binding protein [Burkholderia stagnalis]RQQ63413.1 ATP-binding protein [Burkholderia stagnalis]RQQ77156.1 ATP-binding protein [Burkholderia stagnalis]RQQ84313.1 ATP-binding protein [Burkholderia stagnalis]RQQ85227.1 ATP-binding protein [Burkholderia stagnalis]